MSEANYKKRAIIAAFGFAGVLGLAGWAIPFFRKLISEISGESIPTTISPEFSTTAVVTPSTKPPVLVNSSILTELNKSPYSNFTEIETPIQILQKIHSNEHVQKILENGCYCSWIESGNYPTQTQITMNDIDKICKDWSAARFCLNSSENSTCNTPEIQDQAVRDLESQNLELQSKTFIDPDTQDRDLQALESRNAFNNYFINKNDDGEVACQKSLNSECQQLLCKVDLFHSKSIAQFMNDDNEFSNKNLEACESGNGNNSTTRNFVYILCELFV